MSRPKKPPALKLIAGTLRSDREAPAAQFVNLPSIKDAPPAPHWLPNAHAVREWNRLAPILAAVGLLTDASLPVLGHLCSLHGKLAQLWASGETPAGNMLAQYRALVGDFGLTPVAQGRVKPHAVARKENPFSRSGKPPQGDNPPKELQREALGPVSAHRVANRPVVLDHAS